MPIRFRTSQLSSSLRSRPLMKRGNQGRHQRDREDRHADHGEALGEGQRMERLAFLPGQGEHGNERQEDDDHREEDRPAHRAAGRDDDLARVAGDLLVVAEMGRQVMRGVFHHHDRLIHQDADRDGDPRERHDVRGDAEVPHQNERDQHRQRQRHADHHRAAEVHQDQQDRHRGDDHLVA